MEIKRDAKIPSEDRAEKGTTASKEGRASKEAAPPVA